MLSSLAASSAWHSSLAAADDLDPSVCAVATIGTRANRKKAAAENGAKTVRDVSDMANLDGMETRWGGSTTLPRPRQFGTALSR
jgi:hypothetical protein